MGYTPLSEKIVRYMSSRPGRHVSSPGMADIFVTNLYADEYKKKGKTIPQLSAEINSTLGAFRRTGKHPQIKDVEGSSNPKKYFWVGEAPSSDIKTETAKTPKGKPEGKNEKALYDLLKIYLKNNGIRADRIRESASKKSYKGKNRWRHPDLVGVEAMIGNKKWQTVTDGLAKHSNFPNARLWSFEVKDEVTASTVRECYSQAISNSSWANLGYLCVGKIADKDKEKTERELEILSNRHGIGIIIIDKQNPNDSYIHIHARENKDIDLDFCNLLVMENTDFEEFIKRAAHVYEIGVLS